MKKIFFIVIISFLISCNTHKGDDTFIDTPDIPLEPIVPEVIIKPKSVWVDAHANFSRLSTKSAISSYLIKMKEVGLNEVYVDVKPGIGYALYDSDILPQLEQWGDESVIRDWDYLGYWLEEAQRLEIDVIATISTLGYGNSTNKDGLIYNDPKWIGKTQMAMLDPSNPNNIVDIRNQTGVDAAMLNPCLPEVQSFIISIVQEIATKYPKLKGICLDYCRWYGANYGFGNETIASFSAYIGENVSNKNDIITKSGGVGRLYNKWIEFRSMTINNLVTNIQSSLKVINPNIELHFWASAHWKSRYTVGQNWASKNYIPTTSSIYTSTYNKTAFADKLDVFVLGAYADAVWVQENPNSDWSVENFVKTYGNYVKGDCTVYGSIAAYAHDKKAISDAVYLCLKNADGLMIFDLSHVIDKSTWSGIKDGIDRIEKK